MLGFLLSFGTALLKAATDVSFKRASGKVANDEILLIVQRGIEAIVSLAVILILVLLWDSYAVRLSNILTPYFVLLIIGAAFFNGLGLYLNIKALRISDVSVVSPMSQLTPAVLLVTSPLMLGESISLYGVIGVLLVVVGSYSIGITKEAGAISFFGPIRALASDRGVRLALISSILYGVSSNIDKLGAQATDPFVWTFCSAIVIFGALSMFTFIQARSKFVLNSEQVYLASIPGFTSGIGSLLQMIAITLWPVPYVIAVKRLSSLFSVITGALFFGEKNILPRMVGALIMVIGTAVIVILG